MSPMRFYIFAGLLLATFAVIHSLFASLRVKQVLQDRMGIASPYYRLIYNVVSIALLALYPLLMLPYDQVMYRIDPPLAWLMVAVQVVGGMIVLRVLFFEFDGAAFFGIRQLLTPRKGKAAVMTPLRTTGLFALCRHPLYLGTMMVVAVNPVMTRALFCFAIFTAIYAYVGSYFEEHRLVATFGDEYRAYQQRTKRVFPYLL